MGLAALLRAAWGRLPESWRARMPDRLRRAWHHSQEQRRHQDLPVRLTFPEGRKVRAVIFGEFADDWLPAFVNPEVWRRVGVAEVLRVADTPPRRVPPPMMEGSRTAIIPLSLANIRNCPSGCDSLIPDAAALATLGNKRKFADYMAASGLAHLCPKTYATDAEAEFPAS